ncbi:hypothetical protein FLAV_00687 [Flavobacteriales bacterium]|nr:hypothetical protein [Flavobacteriales bacterium]MCL4815344.1 CotH kinase family protein [Flavobacteriales bacterium]WKZ74963.1 MAG: CotH kinase family protein [Vicingaceae bacterium]CAG0960727.1 hypothetical protein FLAV_00687 [Flavobacteriales bacterium]
MKKILFLFFIPFLSFSQNINHWETVVYAPQLWTYLLPNTEPSANWKNLGFNTSGWNTGKAGIGYGDNDDSTVITNTVSVYMRIEFNISDTSKIAQAVLSMDYDDAFVAYLNGVEIARANIGTPGTPPPYNQTSAGLHEAQMYQGGKPDDFIINKNTLAGLLLPGTNVLAIQTHNDNIGSSDLSSIPFLHLGITDNSSNYGPTPNWFTPPLNFITSNLPIIVIETNGQTIIDQFDVIADMGIVDNGIGQSNNVNGPYNNYNGKINIQIRGSSSQSFPKKGYSVETTNLLGNALNTPLLGMPAENDWVLHGPYSDKSLMRNYLTYSWATILGNYAPRVRFCEVVINGDYKGVYVLTEKMKRDENRVNISKLNPDDTTGKQLTGGYLFKIDKYTGNSSPGWQSPFSPPNASSNQKINFQFHDPKEIELLPVQKTYIKMYVDSFEKALNSPNFDNPNTGWKKYAEWGSFINYFLVNELTKNVDGYRLSTFLHKNKINKYGNGRIFIGPVWDYNIALGNANYCAGGTTTGWAYNFNSVCNGDSYLIPFWWNKLITDTAFVNETRCHWNYRRQGIWHNDSIAAFIDSMATYLSQAQQRNFQRWPIFGTWVWPNNYIGNNYADEIQYLKNWLINRANWIDANLPGACHWITSVPSVPKTEIENFILFPNPANQSVFIEIPFITNTPIQLQLINLTGKQVLKRTFNYSQSQEILELNLSEVVPGMYFVKLQIGDTQYVRKLMKE